MDQADRVSTAHEQNGMPLAWGAVVRRGLWLGYAEGRRAAQDAVAATGTAWPRCRLVCPQSFPLGLSTRSPLGTSRATEEGEGEEEEDARRTFEAGPERPLGVIDDGLPRRDLRMLRGLRWLLAARWRHGASVLLVELRQMARR